MPTQEWRNQGSLMRTTTDNAAYYERALMSVWDGKGTGRLPSGFIRARRKGRAGCALLALHSGSIREGKD